MLSWSAIIFVLAAIAGATTAYVHFFWHAEKRPPNFLAVFHGLFAALALTMLAVGIYNSEGGFAAGLTSPPVIAFAIFILAALGGVYMFLGRQVRRRPLPSKVLLAHATAATVGFLVLLSFLLGWIPSSVSVG